MTALELVSDLQSGRLTADDFMQAIKEDLPPTVCSDAMIAEQRRLESFNDWPFDQDAKCKPDTLAAAGFYHTPTGDSPDAVRCFTCLKDLEGWEAEDDPWMEHRSHSPNCAFVKLGKQQDKLTVEQMLGVLSYRKQSIVRRLANEVKLSVEKAVEKEKERLTQLAARKVK